MVALLLAGANTQAQQVPAPVPRPRAVLPPAPMVRPPSALDGRIADLPPQWIEQLQEMSPAEQERFLSNNERFRSLPVQRQAQIRRRLRVWNGLRVEQQQALLERQQIWEQLPPNQRRQVRESLLPRWQTLPAVRRRVILAKLRELRGLDGALRRSKLNDESFLENLNADERQMLRELSNLGVDEALGYLIPLLFAIRSPRAPISPHLAHPATHSVSIHSRSPRCTTGSGIRSEPS